MGNWKKFIMGEKMPDKDDPQYKEKYEKDVDAGRRFAKWSKLDKVAARVQHFANNHTKAFLTIVFGFIFISFAMNIYRMGCVWSKNENAKKNELPQTGSAHEGPLAWLGSLFAGLSLFGLAADRKRKKKDDK